MLILSRFGGRMLGLGMGRGGESAEVQWVEPTATVHVRGLRCLEVAPRGVL